MAEDMFKMDIGELLNGLIELDSKFDAALKMYCDTSCRRLEGYAKQNAPWTDRSGAARQRLTSNYTKTEIGYRLNLAHNVKYGVFLEFAHEKNFAIIWPTIQYVGPQEIMPGLNNMLEKIGYKSTEG